jgi:hypothetical protein
MTLAEIFRRLFKRCTQRKSATLREDVLGGEHHPWSQMSDWLLIGAIEEDEKVAMDLAGLGYHINRSNLLVLESKADMQKRGDRDKKAWQEPEQAPSHCVAQLKLAGPPTGRDDQAITLNIRRTVWVQDI